MNFSSENGDSIRTKYQEVAGLHKGDGLVFLLGDVEASQGALQVSKASFTLYTCAIFLLEMFLIFERFAWMNSILDSKRTKCLLSSYRLLMDRNT
jgi:hypothetical protein